MKYLPLITNKSLASFIIDFEGRFVSCQGLLQDASQLAAELPEKSCVINLCKDSYNFLRGFLAALMRKQITLFPPNPINEQTLTLLDEEYSDCYVLSDEKLMIKDLVCVAMHEFVSGKEIVINSIPEIAALQPACVFFTSGSTGTPLAYQKTWEELVNRAHLMAKILHFDQATDIIATVPLQHLFGFEHCVMLCLQSKAILYNQRIMFPEDLRYALQHIKNQACLVSTPYHLECFLRSAVAFPSVPLILSSTAVLSADLNQQIQKKFQAQLVEIYGCTEAGAIATRQWPHETTWHLINGLSLSQEKDVFFVTDKATNKTSILPDNIAIHSPTEFSFISRKQDNVNIAGKRMSLADLTSKLTAIEGVIEGIVYLPDYLEQQMRLIAFVVTDTLSEHIIKEKLSEQVDPLFVPKHLFILKKLPRNEVGKISKAALDKLVIEHFHPKFEFSVPATHPALAGHFPDNPVIPGVVILERIVACFKKIDQDFKLQEFIQVKFLKRLQGGEHLTVEFSQHLQGIQFKVLEAENAIVTGIFK